MSELVIIVRFQNELQHEIVFHHKPSFAEFKSAFESTLKEYFTLPGGVWYTHTFHYIDDEGDKIKLTKPLEWDTMLSHDSGWKSYVMLITIESDLGPVVPQPRSGVHSSLSLQGQVFATWLKEKDDWKPYQTLIFNEHGLPIINNKIIATSPGESVESNDVARVEIKWSSSLQNSHSGYCMFFCGAKPGYYWDATLPQDTIVFTGWLQIKGDPNKLDFRGVSVPTGSNPKEITEYIAQMESNERRTKAVKQSQRPQQSQESQPQSQQPQSQQPQQPQQSEVPTVTEPTLTPEQEEELRLLALYGEQIKQLFSMGFEDIRLNLPLLESFQGDVGKVIDRIYSA